MRSDARRTLRRGHAAERDIDARERVSLQHAHEKSMAPRRACTVVRDVPGYDVRARNDGVQERMRRARRLEPVHTLQVTHPYFGAPPSVPRVVNSNEDVPPIHNVSP